MISDNSIDQKSHEILQGTGPTSIWGFSKALDLLQQASEAIGREQDLKDIKNSHVASTEQETINILLVGCADIRHLIKTVCRSWRHGIRPKIHASLLARHLLLLFVFFDPSLNDMGLQERAELFLECYGNLMIRQKTANWLQTVSSDLIRVVTDGKGLLGSLVDVSQLKFRERDDIEFVFKFWRDAQNKSFQASQLWDYRLRQYYTTRYDVRDNAIDWDYHMKFKDLDKELASIVYKGEFLRWRLHGTAFEVRESAYDAPNRSMATVNILKQDGVGVTKWGYFSDILLGPFCAFGLDTEAKSMLVKNNDKHKYSSQDVCEFNIRSLLHEFQTNSVYNEAIDDATSSTQNNRLEEIPEEEPEAIPLDPMEKLRNVKITLLPCESARTFKKKRSKYSGFFHKIVVSNAMAHVVSQTASFLNPNGELIVETAKYMMELTDDQKSLFTEKVQDLAVSASLKRSFPPKLNDSVDDLVFVKSS